MTRWISPAAHDLPEDGEGMTLDDQIFEAEARIEAITDLLAAPMTSRMDRAKAGPRSVMLGWWVGELGRLRRQRSANGEHAA